jgi:pimeloyl-ACP methyl ester carboxylesterase
MAMADGIDRYFHFDGLRHHYIVWGADNDRTVLMLHGIRGYAGTWRKVANRLANNYRVIALDHRGRGCSDWCPRADYFAATYVLDIAALVRCERLAAFALVGHSMGGANAFVYAARHPEQVAALVIEDIGPGSSEAGVGKERILRELRQTPSSFSSWDEAANYWRRIRPGISADALNSRLAETLVAKEDKIAWRYDFEGVRKARFLAAQDPSKLPDLWACIDNLLCPTLVIRGANSDYVTADSLASMRGRNHRIETHETPDATHYVHDDNLPDFMLAIEEFLGKTFSPKDVDITQLFGLQV